MKPNYEFSDVIICDDHFVSVVGIETLLRSYSSKPLNIRKASTGKMALDLMQQKVSDLAVVDLGLPDISGVEIVKQIRAKSLSSFVIVLTGTADQDKLRETSKLQINGLLRKAGTGENLTIALDFIRANPDQVFLDSTVKEILKTPTVNSSLTSRELEVLELMAAGLTTKEIAEKMNCAVSTIKTYRTRIMNRSGARNSAEMMAWYLKRNGKKDFSSDS